MTTVLPSARPPSAISLWRDGIDLLVEFPTTSGVPYIMRIAPTEHAVSKLLDIIRGAAPKQTFRRSLAKPSHTMVRKVIGRDTYSEEQRANARAVLKRMGIT